VRSGIIYPRLKLFESDVSPGDAWELVCNIKCDGVPGKLWRRVVVATPVVCVVCGNTYEWHVDSDKCPYCHPELAYDI
jgi:hypothetical protein